MDVAGGEAPVTVLVRGCLKALRQFPGLRLLLAGDRERIKPALRLHPRLARRIEILHTDQVIAMDENPVRACLAKPRASVLLAADAVAKGKAFGLYSPGNTGAVLAAATMRVGLLPGLTRPALAAPLPTLRGYSLLLDAGASIDIAPPVYLQFARLGRAFIQAVLDKQDCRIGLVNIGSEPNKGTPKVKQAYKLLTAREPCFAGNVEGHDVFAGAHDVVLCDGFVGNVILKLSEGLGSQIVRMVRARNGRRKESDESRLRRRLGERFVSRQLRKLTDSEHYGGAPLLGARGIVLIGHGQARSRAVYNAIATALDYHAKDVVGRMAAALAEDAPPPARRRNTPAAG